MSSRKEKKALSDEQFLKKARKKIKEITKEKENKKKFLDYVQAKRLEYALMAEEEEEEE